MSPRSAVAQAAADAKTTDDEEIWFEQVNNGECNRNTQINRMVAFANKGLNYNADN